MKLQIDHISLIAWQTMRAYKRVIDPKTKVPYWYDVAPEDQEAFHSLIEGLVAGKRPEAAAKGQNAVIAKDVLFLVAAVVNALVVL